MLDLGAMGPALPAPPGEDDHRACLARAKRWAVVGAEEVLRCAAASEMQESFSAAALELTVSISQVECFDPACAGLETVLCIFVDDEAGGGAWRFTGRRNMKQPLAEVLEATMRGRAAEIAQEALREYRGSASAASSSAAAASASVSAAMSRARWLEGAPGTASGADGSAEEQAWAAALGGVGSSSSSSSSSGDGNGTAAMLVQNDTRADCEDVERAAVGAGSSAGADAAKVAQRAAMAGGWNMGTGSADEWGAALAGSAPSTAGAPQPAHQYGCPCCSF